jgi:hypothetical protein
VEETDEEGKTETRIVPDNVKVVVPIDEEYLEAQDWSRRSWNALVGCKRYDVRLQVSNIKIATY